MRELTDRNMDYSNYGVLKRRIGELSKLDGRTWFLESYNDFDFQNLWAMKKGSRMKDRITFMLKTNENRVVVELEIAKLESTLS